jgi:hypothetical protein
MIAIVDPIAHRRARANRRNATPRALHRAQACSRKHPQPLCRKPVRARSPSHHRITAHA